MATPTTPTDQRPEDHPKSWKVEVQTSDGQWNSNGLRFQTQDGADMYGQNLYTMWTVMRDYRVVPSNDEPNQDR